MAACRCILAFAEPIDLTTDLGLARANQWVGDLANRLHGDTNATDPARIFRLPDTENHKPAYGKPSPLTTLLVANPDLRYAFDEVVAVLGDADPSQPPQPVSQQPTLTHDLDEHTRINMARSWLKSRPPAVAGKGGNKHTYDLACAVSRGHDLDEQDALVAMRDWNATSLPPWNEPELLGIIRHAVRYAKGRTGSELGGATKTASCYRITSATSALHLKS